MRTLNYNNLNRFDPVLFGQTENLGGNFENAIQASQMYQNPPLTTYPSGCPVEVFPVNKATAVSTKGANDIQVLDIDGNPLANAHVKVVGSTTGGVVTDAYGFADLSGILPTELVEISFIGKKSYRATKENLGGNITLQDDPITNSEVPLTTQQKANRTLLWGIAGAALIFGVAAVFSKDNKKPKKSKKQTIPGLAGAKTKKKRKAKKKTVKK